MSATVEKSAPSEVKPRGPVTVIDALTLAREEWLKTGGHIEPIIMRVAQSDDLGVRSHDSFVRAYDSVGGGESGDVILEAIKIERRLAAKAAAK